MKESSKHVKEVYQALSDKKAEDIKIIHIGDISVIADYFVIAHGNNAPHVEALVDSVKEQLGRKGIEPARIEGIRSSGWILMDYGDFVVHVFSSEDRLFYDLERIWKDGKTVDVNTL